MLQHKARPTTGWLATVLATTLQAGCATPQADPAAYDASLAPWRGATEELLRSQWGPPYAEGSSGAGKRLTYITRSGGNPSGATVGISLGGIRLGGSGAVGGGVGVAAPISTGGATCTTHFQVEQGKVVSWTFDGPGCGAAPG